MTITPFETNLYQQLAPFFSEHGYTLLPEKKQFRRVTQSGFQNVILSSVYHPEDTVVEVNFGGRNEQVEQIAQQFLFNTSDSGSTQIRFSCQSVATTGFRISVTRFTSMRS